MQWLRPLLPALLSVPLTTGCFLVRQGADRYGSPEFITQTSIGGPALAVTVLTLFGAWSSITGEKKSGFLFIACIAMFFIA